MRNWVEDTESGLVCQGDFVTTYCVDTGKGVIAIRGIQAPDKGLHFVVKMP